VTERTGRDGGGPPGINPWRAIFLGIFMFTLEEAMRAVQGHDEFVVKSYDGLVCIDYTLCFPESFDYKLEEVRKRSYSLWEEAGRPQDDGRVFWLRAEEECKRWAWFRRNFRGVTFDASSGKIVSLPLHKFFNIDQTLETQVGSLSGCQARIYEKVDGSMIHFFVHPQRGELQAATCRSSQTPQAQEALVLAQKNHLVFERIHAIIGEGWTPVFEFVAAHNQVVVQYPHPRLVYLISRNRDTGEYRFHDGFPDSAKSYEFSFSDIHSHLYMEEFEGYVCHLDNGMLVKAKTPWYFERHRAVDYFMRPMYKLYQLVYDNVMDDLLGIAPDRFKVKLKEIYEQAQRDLLNEQRRVEALFDSCLTAVAGNPYSVSLPEVRKADKVLRKKFVLHAQGNHQDDFSFLMAHYVGNDPTAKIQERLMEGYKTKYPGRLFSDLEEEVTA
jgi:T4 RnlA family RNA ligase